jgi:hypothetical protein
MNENFKALAVEALRAAWPCQRKRMRELNDDVERRTTSMGLFNTAEAYRLSAIKLRAGKKVKTGHADTPVRLLYYHALELYLKALLRQKYIVKTLRERIKATTGDAVPSRFQSTDLDPELVRKPLRSAFASGCSARSGSAPRIAPVGSIIWLKIGRAEPQVRKFTPEVIAPTPCVTIICGRYWADFPRMSPRRSITHCAAGRYLT